MRAQDRRIARWISEHGRARGSERVAPQSKEVELHDTRTRKQDIENGSHVVQRSPLRSPSFRQLLIVAIAAMLVAWHVVPRLAGLVEWYRAEMNVGKVETCPQVAPLAPSRHSELLERMESLYATEPFKTSAYAGLSGAVRIPTEMFDDLKPPGEDPHWEIFGKLHEFLEAKFPTVHTTLEKTLVNSYALVYHWQGSDDSLKPLLLTAHQDVVPVEPTTISSWKNPPFSGLYDGEWIWGRGSCDDKSGLISSLTAVESLLEADFKPRRTVVFAFGIDEERGGIVGATALRDYLLATYGENAFAMLVDEGGRQDMSESVVVASPAVAEKGSFNLRMEVSTPGGHSSVPPAHTSIGMLAALITELEAHPHVPALHRNDTAYEQLQCLAAHSPDFSSHLAQLVKKSRHSDKALAKLTAELERTNPLFKATAGTTQAVDVIRGGVKTNALPENAHVIVNHRIAGYSSVGALQARLVDVLSPVAARFNLSVDAFGRTLGENAGYPAAGKLKLSDAFGTAIEPAPITPTTDSPPYELLSGVIRNVVETSQRDAYKGKKVLVAPSILLGNTDTKHYWKLTKHIFRYSHLNVADGYNGAHTINEAIRAEGYLEMIRFFTQLILNVDETDTLL